MSYENRDECIVIGARGVKLSYQYDCPWFEAREVVISIYLPEV